MQTAPQIVTLELNHAGRAAWDKAFTDEWLSMNLRAIEAEEARILTEWGPLAPLMMPERRTSNNRIKW